MGRAYAQESRHLNWGIKFSPELPNMTAMTVVVFRFRVGDIPALREIGEQRSALKASHGCTSSRLLVDRGDPSSVIAVMEFPSYELARRYSTTSIAFLRADEIALMTDLKIEYFEDAPSGDYDTGLVERAAVSAIIA